MNEAFSEYIEILDELSRLQDTGQVKAEAAIEELRTFIIDNRICSPEALITINESIIDIRTSENYSTERILSIEEFTGFKMIFKDNGHIVLKY